MWKTLSYCILAILVVALVTVRGRADDSKQVSELMRKKLNHSQKVLEGLALGDYDRIAKEGDELLLISKQLEWKVYKTTEYEMFSNDFRRAVETMIEKAKEKNLDGATLAYVNLTMTCVKCHKYVREVRKI